MGDKNKKCPVKYRVEMDTVEVADGIWVPALPEPYYLMFRRQCCKCGEKFFTKDGYMGHYALRHILHM